MWFLFIWVVKKQQHLLLFHYVNHYYSRSCVLPQTPLLMSDRLPWLSTLSGGLWCDWEHVEYSSWLAGTCPEAVDCTVGISFLQVWLVFPLMVRYIYYLKKSVFSSARDYPVPKKSLQLVGVTARLIAYKYEEIAPPMVEDFAHTTDLTYSCAEIRLMEMTILKALNYELGWPPPVHFLRRAAKVEGEFLNLKM